VLTLPTSGTHLRCQYVLLCVHTYACPFTHAEDNTNTCTGHPNDTRIHGAPAVPSSCPLLGVLRMIMGVHIWF
jgi:hypothetical protein